MKTAELSLNLEATLLSTVLNLINVNRKKETKNTFE